MTTVAVIFIVLAVLTCIAIFVRSRASGRVGVFEITQEDRAALQEVRRELGIRRLLGRLIGGFGGILVLAGLVSPLYPDSSGRVDWRIAGVLIAFGSLLVMCAVPLVKARSSR
jgi:drug/metabolite transporter superfamily protein YnfA